MSDGREWRDHQNGIAALLSNFTKSVIKWNNRTPVEPDVPFATRPDSMNGSPSGYAIYPPLQPAINHTYPRSHLKTDREFQSLLNYWDSSPDAEGIETSSSAGNYESVIIGLTLLILCLLVIAIILIIAMFRVRQLRLVGGTRSLSHSQPRHGGDAEISVRVNEASAYVIGAPPAYQMQIQKPVCPEPPPSYEYLMQSSVEEENVVESDVQERRSESVIESENVTVRTDEQNDDGGHGQVHIQTISANVP